MKVILLNPPSKHADAVVRDTLYGCWCKGRASYMWPPLGLAYIAGVLEAEGHEVGIIDGGAEKKTFEEVISDLQSKDAQAVVFNTATITFGEDLEISEQIKNAIPDLVTIHVGTHVTVYPESSLKYNGIDFVVIGEPEYGVRDLVNALEKEEDLHEVKGIGFKTQGEIVLTAPREPIKNLDELPFPARHLIPDIEYFNPLAKRLPYTTMLSSRGCPFKCIYCTAVTLYGRRYRARSAQNVVDEIAYLTNDLGIKEVLFRDETFTFDRKRAMRICDLIRERDIDVTWICNTRVDMLTEELIKAMKGAGCHTIKFGVESGNQQILDNLKKGITLEQTRNTFKWTKKHGIRRAAHFMLGSPGETKETIEETLNFVIHELDPDYISPNITTPYPGTELFDLVLEKGYEPSDDWSTWNLSDALENAVFNEMYSDVTKEDLNTAFNRAYKEFYFRPRYLLRMLLGARSVGEFTGLFKAGFSLLNFVKSREK